MAGWCSGAPGIGLARLGTLSVHHTQKVHEDIANALAFAFTLNYPPYYSDHICCGNGGRIELLIEAGHRLNQPELLTEAGKRLSWMLQRKKELGHYVFHGENKEAGALFNPSLFQGLAGIGYELLRLFNREGIPSILT